MIKMMIKMMNKLMWKCVVSLGLILSTQACSVLYDVQQDVAQENCQRMSDHYQRSECLKNNSMNFEQYEKQREKIRKN